MAGVKGKSGGKRVNAGRKKNPPDKINGFKDIAEVYPTMQKNDIPLVMPDCIKKSKYAAEAWSYVMECDKNSKYHLINQRHLETVISYCMAVAMRRRLIQDWQESGEAVSITTANGTLKINPVVEQMNKSTRLVNECASELGLSVLSEYKMAREAKSGDTLTGEEKKDEDNLFE